MFCSTAGITPSHCNSYRHIYPTIDGDTYNIADEDSYLLFYVVAHQHAHANSVTNVYRDPNKNRDRHEYIQPHVHKDADFQPHLHQN